jgi:hypothetical protein
MNTAETFCAIIEEIFQSNQQVIGYKSCQMNATDTVIAIRSNDEVAKQWINDVCRAIRDRLMRNVELKNNPMRTDEHVFQPKLFVKLAAEVAADRILFHDDARGKQWTAGAFTKTVEHNPTLAKAYSDAFTNLLLIALQQQAKNSPSIRSRPIVMRT